MYNFKNFNSDLKNHIKKNKTVYIVLFLCFFIGIIIGFIISVSNISFLGLLSTKNKTFINFVNGSTSLTLTFWNSFFQFLISVIIVFILSLNFYLNFFNFIFFIYQIILLF